MEAFHCHAMCCCRCGVREEAWREEEGCAVVVVAAFFHYNK